MTLSQNNYNTKRKIRKLEKMVSKLKVNNSIADDDKDLSNIMDVMGSIPNDEVDISTFNTPIIGLLLNRNFGLREIKREIIEIENKLDCGHFPGHNIISILKKIEKLLKNPYFGLKEIKKEIRNIEDKLDHPDFGLEEIKDEIRDIEDKLDQLVPFSGVLTTGAVVADNGVNSIVSKVLNNTDEEVTVTVRLFDIGTCPDPKTIVKEKELTIDPKCAKDFIFPKPPTQWEIEYEGIVTDIFVFTAGRSNGQNAPLSASNLNPTNTFRHSEHIPTQDP